MKHFTASIAILNGSRLLVGLLLLALVSCQTGAPRDTLEPSLQSGKELVTSPNDQREYQTLQLPNRLRVLVISDPEADKSAAALNVFYGSFADPADRQGLAHFLEHMLFLGTEKFPDSDEYQQFISTRGGRHNAYTASDHTNYFFDIAPDHLNGALDRFSQFFVAPLFTEEYVEREKNAVNSEYNLRLKDDGWRTNAVGRQVYNPDHPASRFNIGSLATLADRPGKAVRDDLLRFYEKHYSANRMALVILGRESTSELAAWAREYFSAVPDRDLAAADYDEPLFREGDLPRRLQVKPVKEQYRISWTFPVPGFDSYYRKNPATYIGNIIGHEGRGSLHAVLKQRGWIESLSAGGGRMTSRQGLVTVSIQLTKEGREHQEEIGDLLFRYIALVRREGVQQWLFDEQSTVAKLAFDYQEKGQPGSYTQVVAANYLLYPDHDLLYGPYALVEYDGELLHDYLGYLTPNVVVTQVSPSVTTDDVDPWFNVHFSLGSLPETWQTRWQAALDAEQGEGQSADLAGDLDIVPQNPFLPENLALVQDPATAGEPQMVMATDEISAWMMSDTQFRVPRASVRIRLESDQVYRSATQAVLTRLYSRLVYDALNEYAYPALLAGLGYQISADSRGLVISLSGYNDKQELLLRRILSTLVELEVDADKFERYRQELLRGWRNSRQNPPYQQLMEEVSRILVDPYWSVEELEQAIEPVTPDDLVKWRSAFLSSLHMEAFFHGNITAEGARRTLDRVAAQMLADAPYRPGVPHRRLASIAGDGGYTRTIEVDHQDAAMVLYLQGDEQGYAARAAYGLMVQILRAPYFNDIRTEKQLGYLVAATTRIMVDTPGVLFIVQSPVAPAGDIYQLTRDFGEAFRGKLAEMSDEEFEQNRRSLVDSLLEKDQNLMQRSGRLWADFNDGVLSFDSREQIAADVEAIDKPQIMALFDKLLGEMGSQFLLLQAPGKFGPGEGQGEVEGEVIEDPRAFKKGRTFFTHRADQAGE